MITIRSEVWVKLSADKRIELLDHLSIKHDNSGYLHTLQAYPQEDPIEVVCLECGEWFKWD